MKTETKEITHEEWTRMQEGDEILSFFAKVNAAATAKEYWSEDFRRAFYDAAHEELSRYAMRKFNNGEGFIIRGAGAKERESHNAEVGHGWLGITSNNTKDTK